MSTPISRQERQELDELHNLYIAKTRGYTKAGAAFLIISALIVIVCSSLCLTLPGVNAMTQIILPAIVPSLFAIILSIPLIIQSVKEAREAEAIREIMIDTMIGLLNKYEVPYRNKDERLDFVLKNFLQWQAHPTEPKKFMRNVTWYRDYQQKLITDLKKEMGEKKEGQTDEQKKIARTLDKALNRLYKNKT